MDFDHHILCKKEINLSETRSFFFSNVKGVCRLEERLHFILCLQHLIDLVLNNSSGRILPRNEVTPRGSKYIPYAKGIYEKFKRVVNRYNTRTGFGNHSLWISNMKTR
jgi:hypothetical protein